MRHYIVTESMEAEQNYSDLLRLVQSRRSVRRFLPEPLPAGTIERLIDAARWAPSAGNRQPYRFLVVTAAPTIARLAEAVRAESNRLAAGFRADLADEMRGYVQSFSHFATAPALIVPIYRAGIDLLAADGSGQREPGAPPRVLVDALSSVAAAITNLLLAAHALGLGACWMTGPLVAAGELRGALEVPDGWHIAALIPVGRPAEHPAAPPRRELRRLLRMIE